MYSEVYVPHEIWRTSPDAITGLQEKRVVRAEEPGQGILGGDMRVTISHDKGQKEAMRIVDRSAQDLIGGIPTGPVKISNPEKSWDGNTMKFSFKAKMGLFGTSIHGTVLVNEKDATIDIELPGILKNFFPEEKIRSAVETKVKGLLA